MSGSAAREKDCGLNPARSKLLTSYNSSADKLQDPYKAIIPGNNCHCLPPVAMPASATEFRGFQGPMLSLYTLHLHLDVSLWYLFGDP